MLFRSGDWTNPHLSGWREVLLANAISPQQQFAYTVGKNATDSALIIDAMDLLYSGNLEAFAIVSSDSDFTRLATRLRESGKTVYGLGRRRTPPSLVAACDKFIYLEVLKDDDATDEEGTDAEPAAEEQAPLPDLHKLLTSAIDATSDDDGWAHLASVGSYLGSSQSSFDPRNYGFGKLVTLARAQDYVEVEERDDHVIRVRLVARPSSRRRGGQARKRTPAKE